MSLPVSPPSDPTDDKYTSAQNPGRYFGNVHSERHEAGMGGEKAKDGDVLLVTSETELGILTCEWGQWGETHIKWHTRATG